MNNLVNIISAAMQNQAKRQRACKHKDTKEFTYWDQDQKYDLIEKGLRCKKCDYIIKIPRYNVVEK